MREEGDKESLRADDMKKREKMKKRMKQNKRKEGMWRRTKRKR